MKRITTIICGLLVGNVYAESLCGYKDYFHFSQDVPSAAYISSVSTEPDLSLQVINSRSFLISDTPRCHSGYADIYVTLDTVSACHLRIKDGPMFMHPTIQASCAGALEYKDLIYDGIGTNSYTLKFDYTV